MMGVASIHKIYDLPWPAEDVYAAWVSSDTVIAPAQRMDVDATVGGHYRLFMGEDMGGLRNEGQFIEVVPNQRVRYTWNWVGDEETTEITVQFQATNSGTRIDLEHHGFLSDESRTTHDQGWDSYIEGFQKHLQAS